MRKHKYNVLSTFDGMSCMQIALHELGIPIGKYYASEIDKWAIQQTQHNFPETIQLGSVTEVRVQDLDRIDIFCGGSPCQGFSFAGKGLNFEDQRSKLFFEFVRLWDEVRAINPDALFLLENVNMKKDHLRVISEYMGLFPVRINSNLVSAQNRDRWYWTNIRTKSVGLFSEVYSHIPQPTDRGIYLKDILQDESEIDDKYYLSDKMIKTIIKHGAINTIDNNKCNCLLSNYFKMGGRDQQYIRGSVKFGRTEEAKAIRKENQEKGKDYTPFSKKEITHIDPNKMGTLTTNIPKDNIICVAQRGRGDNNAQQLEPIHDNKTNAITSVTKDNLIMQINTSKESNDKQPQQQNRIYDTEGISPALTTDSRSPMIVQRPRGYNKGGTHEDKVPPITSNSWDQNNLLSQDFRLRRLTPTECARLQTIPDWYKWIVSDTQQYKMLGNGWTVAVIMHILSHMPQLH